MKKRNIAIIIGCVIVCCIAFLFIFRGYYDTSADALDQLLYDNQEINIQVQRGEIISKVEDVHTTLKTMAAVLEECESEEEMRKFDSVMEEMSAAKEIQAQGVQYYSFKELRIDIMTEEDQRTIEALKEGESVVSSIYRSPVDHKNYYGIAEPVSLNGQYVGFIRGLIASETLVHAHEVGVFGDEVETYLIHSDGDNALQDHLEEDENDNLFEITRKICDEPEEFDKLKKKMDSGSESAAIQTTSQGKTLIISCAALPYNDWMVFNVLHSEKASGYAREMAEGGRNTSLTVVGLTLLIIIFFIAIYYYGNKEQHFEQKRAAQLANFSDTVLCEYEMKKDYISCTSNIRKMLPVQDTKVNQFSVFIQERGLISPKDMDTMHDILTIVPKEGEVLDYEIRLRNAQGEYNWYRIDVTALYIRGKLQNHLILKISDITESKEKELGLMQKAQSDALTGLLNRSSFENKVRNQIEEGSGGYLFLLDLDNFKQINDSYGHQSGDEILKKAGKCIRKSFRSKDYVGRYGGDEFLMFMSAPMSEKVAQRRASILVEEISKIALEQYPDFEMTCSVGVAKYAGEEYEELLKKADGAMYKAKKAGKNSWIML